MNINVKAGTPVAANLSSAVQSDGWEADVEPVVAVVKWFRETRATGSSNWATAGATRSFMRRLCEALGWKPSRPARRCGFAESGPRGRQVGRVLDVDASTSSAPAPSAYASRKSPPRPARDLASAIELTGKVKWFDEVRGFGFVACDDFGRDVFVHCSILGGAGAARLVEGQPVTMRVVEPSKDGKRSRSRFRLGSVDIHLKARKAATRWIAAA